MAQVAFIGSRDLDQFGVGWIRLYERAALAAARYGHRGVTGAAEGADQRAAEVILQAGGSMKLVLPWPDYEAAWVNEQVAVHADRVEILVYDEREHGEWGESVVRYHPNPGVLTPRMVRLHARNYGIVEHCFFVVALPSISKRGGGGTAQGIRVANGLGIPLFNLSTAAGQLEMEKRLKGG